MDENNVAYSVLGRAGVVRAPSNVHPLMNVVRINILLILRVTDQCSLRVDSGIRWSFTSPEAEELYKALIEVELEDLSKVL